MCIFCFISLVFEAFTAQNSTVNLINNQIFSFTGGCFQTVLYEKYYEFRKSTPNLSLHVFSDVNVRLGLKTRRVTTTAGCAGGRCNRVAKLDTKDLLYLC